MRPKTCHLARHGEDLKKLWEMKEDLHKTAAFVTDADLKLRPLAEVEYGYDEVPVPQ
jgi:hypothetical protein